MSNILSDSESEYSKGRKKKESNTRGRKDYNNNEDSLKHSPDRTDSEAEVKKAISPRKSKSNKNNLQPKLSARGVPSGMHSARKKHSGDREHSPKEGKESIDTKEKKQHKGRDKNKEKEKEKEKEKDILVDNIIIIEEKQEESEQPASKKLYPYSILRNKNNSNLRNKSVKVRFHEIVIEIPSEIHSEPITTFLSDMNNAKPKAKLNQEPLEPISSPHPTSQRSQPNPKLSSPTTSPITGSGVVYRSVRRKGLEINHGSSPITEDLIELTKRDNYLQRKNQRPLDRLSKLFKPTPSQTSVSLNLYQSSPEHSASLLSLGPSKQKSFDPAMKTLSLERNKSKNKEMEVMLSSGGPTLFEHISDVDLSSSKNVSSLNNNNGSNSSTLNLESSSDAEGMKPRDRKKKRKKLNEHERKHPHRRNKGYKSRSSYSDNEAVSRALMNNGVGKSFTQPTHHNSPISRSQSKSPLPPSPLCYSSDVERHDDVIIQKENLKLELDSWEMKRERNLRKFQERFPVDKDTISSSSPLLNGKFLFPSMSLKAIRENSAIEPPVVIVEKVSSDESKHMRKQNSLLSTHLAQHFFRKNTHASTLDKNAKFQEEYPQLESKSKKEVGVNLATINDISDLDSIQYVNKISSLISPRYSAQVENYNSDSGNLKESMNSIRLNSKQKKKTETATESIIMIEVGDHYHAPGNDQEDKDLASDIFSEDEFTLTLKNPLQNHHYDTDNPCRTESPNSRQEKEKSEVIPISNIHIPIARSMSLDKYNEKSPKLKAKFGTESNLLSSNEGEESEKSSQEKISNRLSKTGKAIGANFNNFPLQSINEFKQMKKMEQQLAKFDKRIPDLLPTSARKHLKQSIENHPLSLINSDYYITTISGPKYDELPQHVGDVLSCHTISTYPHLPGLGRAGDPICDYYYVRLFTDAVILSLADGCNWGEAPKQAAQRASTTFVRYIQDHLHLCTSTHKVAHYLISAISASHQSIIEGYADIWAAGTTTLLGGVLLPYDHLPFKKSASKKKDEKKKSKKQKKSKAEKSASTSTNSALSPSSHDSKSKMKKSDEKAKVEKSQVILSSSSFSNMPTTRKLSKSGPVFISFDPSTLQTTKKDEKSQLDSSKYNNNNSNNNNNNNSSNNSSTLISPKRSVHMSLANVNESTSSSTGGKKRDSMLGLSKSLTAKGRSMMQKYRKEPRVTATQGHEADVEWEGDIDEGDDDYFDERDQQDETEDIYDAWESFRRMDAPLDDIRLPPKKTEGISRSQSSQSQLNRDGDWNNMNSGMIRESSSDTNIYASYNNQTSTTPTLIPSKPKFSSLVNSIDSFPPVPVLSSMHFDVDGLIFPTTEHQHGDHDDDDDDHHDQSIDHIDRYNEGAQRPRLKRPSKPNLTSPELYKQTYTNVNPLHSYKLKPVLKSSPRVVFDSLSSITYSNTIKVPIIEDPNSSSSSSQSNNNFTDYSGTDNVYTNLSDLTVSHTESFNTDSDLNCDRLSSSSKVDFKALKSLELKASQLPNNNNNNSNNSNNNNNSNNGQRQTSPGRRAIPVNIDINNKKFQNSKNSGTGNGNNNNNNNNNSSQSDFEVDTKKLLSVERYHSYAVPVNISISNQKFATSTNLNNSGGNNNNSSNEDVKKDSNHGKSSKSNQNSRRNQSSNSSNSGSNNNNNEVTMIYTKEEKPKKYGAILSSLRRTLDNNPLSNSNIKITNIINSSSGNLAHPSSSFPSTSTSSSSSSSSSRWQISNSNEKIEEAVKCWIGSDDEEGGDNHHHHDKHHSTKTIKNNNNNAQSINRSAADLQSATKSKPKLKLKISHSTSNTTQSHRHHVSERPMSPKGERIEKIDLAVASWLGDQNSNAVPLLSTKVKKSEVYPLKKRKWAFVFVNIGDCKAFLYSTNTKQITDITSANRVSSENAKDCGGRLGPYLPGGSPDLRNLSVHYHIVYEGDIIMILSDGVHDNLDPEMLGLSPIDTVTCMKKEDIELIGSANQWTDLDKDVRDRAKTAFRESQLATIIGDNLESISTTQITKLLTNYCRNITMESRRYMEQNPSIELPEDYNRFPGKMDHTTCICFRVGDVDSDVDVCDESVFQRENLAKLKRKITDSLLPTTTE